MTFKDQFIEHLKSQSFEFQEEADGDDTLVRLINSDPGIVHMTLVFDKDGNLADVWNPKNDRLQELEEKIKEQAPDAEFGKSVKTLLKTFKEL